MEEKIVHETKIEGDFAFDGKVIFKNDIEITGSLNVGEVKADGSIYVHHEYIVARDDNVANSQTVGWHQTVGGHQTVGRSQKVGGYQTVVGPQTVGWYQTVGGSQTVGWSQKVGGDITVARSIVTGLSIKARGTIKCGDGYGIFAGTAAHKNCPNNRIIKCAAIIGEVLCGKVEIIPEPEKVTVRVGDAEYSVSPKQAEEINKILTG